MSILLGLRPREVLNSPTIAPMLLTIPSLYFQTDIYAMDLGSILMLAVRISYWSKRKPCSMRSYSTLPLPIVCDISETSSFWETEEWSQA